MPYIKPARRKDLDEKIDQLLMRLDRPGELNYALTRLIDGYVRLVTGINYDGLNEVTGVVESVKAEFYRRVVVPYEDLKLAENGDVYGGPK